MSHTPYSPYIRDREELDGGFSAGWGFHFPPSEEYVVDCHAHTDFTGDAAAFRALLDRWFALTEAYRLQKIVLFVRTERQMETMGELAGLDSRAPWMFYPDVREPNLALVRRAKELGACGLKLHSKELMCGDAPYESWDSPAWQEIFAWLEQAGMPVLWHVTQRVSYSPYHGGGYNPYFSEGAKKGVHVTNEMLLEQLCRVLAAYPGLNIVGAHQLYVSNDRLAELFDKYPNLYVDSSVGYFVRWCDQLYKPDRKKHYDFFLRYPDRILFGTDTSLTPAGIGEYQKEAFCSHLRFIHQLRLPHEVLQMVCYGNAERVLSIPPSDAKRKYNTRP